MRRISASPFFKINLKARISSILDLIFKELSSYLTFISLIHFLGKYYETNLITFVMFEKKYIKDITEKSIDFCTAMM